MADWNILIGYFLLNIMAYVEGLSLKDVFIFFFFVLCVIFVVFSCFNFPF